MQWSVLVLCSLLLFSIAKGSPYNKYGRTCRDILCIAGQEECIMENDACTSYSEKCGAYPTCKRKVTATKRGCASMKCDPGHFCSIRQENCARPPCEIKPVCIAFRTPTPTKATVLNNYKPSYGGYDRQQYGSQTYAGNQRGQQFAGQTYSGQTYGNQRNQQFGGQTYPSQTYANQRNQGQSFSSGQTYATQQQNKPTQQQNKPAQQKSAWSWLG